MNVTQLLQLKRLEKPDPDFWAGFERELQQKQLQALVKPSPWAKVQAVFAAPRASLASLSAISAVSVAAILAVFSFQGRTSEGFELASVERIDQQVEPILLVEPVDPVVSEETEDAAAINAPSRTDAFFVVDALRPDGANATPESFRTVAVPETLVGGSDDSAYYVVNAFTTGPGGLASDAALEY